MKINRWMYICISGLLLLLFSCKSETSGIFPADHSRHTAQVFALRYGTSRYPAKLVNHAEKSGKIPLDWLYYLIRDSRGYNILVDTGFYNQSYARQFGIQNYKTAEKLLAELKLTPENITDIIITHSHFDHIEGVVQFQKAKVHINKKEFAQFKNSKDYKTNKAYFLRAEKENRLLFIDDFSNTTIADIYQIIFTGGHTPGSQAVYINAGANIVFTGDECYFRKYCSEKYPLPSGAMYSKISNLNAIKLFQGKNIFTAHDPEIFGTESGSVKKVSEFSLPELTVEKKP